MDELIQELKTLFPYALESTKGFERDEHKGNELIQILTGRIKGIK